MGFINSHLLTLIIALPVAAAVFVLCVPSRWKGVIQGTCILASFLVFALSVLVFLLVDQSGEYDFVENVGWISSIGVSYRIGVDGASALFMALAPVFIMTVMPLAWKERDAVIKNSSAALLVLLSSALSAFSSLDVFLYFISVEVAFFTLFALTEGLRDERAKLVRSKFIAFMAVQMMSMMAAIVYAASIAGSFDVLSWYSTRFSPFEQLWIFGGFALSLGVMIPVFAMHTCYVNMVGSGRTVLAVLLATVFSQLGFIGFYRMAMPSLPIAVAGFVTPTLYVLCIGVLVSGLISMVQRDASKFAAYASMSQMMLSLVGLFSQNADAATGSVILAAGVGLSVSVLLILSGIMRERTGTCDIDGGHLKDTKVLYVFFVVAVLSMMPFPGLLSFAGEFLVLLGSFQTRTSFAAAALGGAVIVALSSAVMLARAVVGNKKCDEGERIGDIRFKESPVLVFLIVLIAATGIWPNVITTRIKGSASAFVSLTKRVDMIIPAKDVERWEKRKNAR